jgi:predicted O-methyltransferase YrrM
MKSKAINLLTLLPRNPREFCDRLTYYAGARLESLFQFRPPYDAVSVDEGLSAIFNGRNAAKEEILREAALTDIEERVKQRQQELPIGAPFARFHNGDPWVGRLCYAVVRMIRPTLVVETGVCYGVTSAYILAALKENDHGHLYSIDLPPLGPRGDDYVGWLIPHELKSRWTLRRGSSDRLLVPLVQQLGTLDLFIHDSLHTFKNMKHEFDICWPMLRPGGLLISDDIEGNDAFHRMVKRMKPSLSVVMKEKNKPALLGVAVKSE